METSDSLSSTPPPQQSAARRSWWWTIRRESAEAGGVILDAAFHPLAHLMALGALLGGLVVLPMTSLQNWFPGCSFLHATGLPCPGCGLTRSVMATLRGDFAAAWVYNPIGILMTLLFLALGVLIFLPTSLRRRLRRALKPAEAWTALLTLAFFLLLLFHGVVRIGLVHYAHPSYAWWQDGRTSPAQVEGEGSAP